MEYGQLAIKIVLISALAAFAIFLMIPGRSVRNTAIRRIVMLALFFAAVTAVAFPDSINRVALLLGVGRGTDLLLYGLIVVFIGNTIVVQRRHRMVERQITLIARRIAISEAAGPSDHKNDLKRSS